VRVFCLSVIVQSIGTMSFPVFFPLLAMTYGLSGTTVGMILAMTPLVTIIAVPAINRFIKHFGCEATIFLGGILYGISFCAIAFATMCKDANMFLSVVLIGSILIGVTIASLIVGEQAILLRYSEKEEREKNLGMFRASSGLGGIISPMLGAGMFAIGEYFAVFLCVGLLYFLICPLIYIRLYRARD